jgi:hypothetical protein
MGEHRIYTDFHYYYHIASQTQMAKSYFGAESMQRLRGEKVIKRKVSTGNHYYLFRWLSGCAASSGKFVGEGTTFCCERYKGAQAKNDSTEDARLFTLIWKIAPLYSLWLAAVL